MNSLATNVYRQLPSVSLGLSPSFIAPPSVEQRLRQALDQNEFVLLYQPKVDTESREIVGFEALIRWQTDEVGVVAPKNFVPLVEESGLIVEVGDWALRRAAFDHRSWTEAGLKPPKVAVNVSAVQLREPDFVDNLVRSLKHGVTPPGIELEVTESVVMDDIEASIAKLQAARRLGLDIAIDDFGTGYSSLSYLARLPVDALKIDQSFIATMAHNPTQAMIVRTIASLGHSLRLTVIAEGVETEEQAKMLALLRCDVMQGYLFSYPLTKEEVAVLLKRKRLNVDPNRRSHPRFQHGSIVGIQKQNRSPICRPF
jgi:EAL domain-containing protein (putative c-di-GMP-specific phosphodiesterase class I)